MNLRVWIIGRVLCCGAFAVSLQQSVGRAQVHGNGARTASVVPFTMTQTITTEQTYANGLIVTSSHEVKVFRDSAGRERAETQVVFRFVPVSSSQEERGWMISINDPVARTLVNWSTQPGSERVVQINHMNHPENVSRTPIPPQSAAENIARPTHHQERLGEKVIQGIAVMGTRTTTIYPLGLFGNNVEFTATREIWTNKEINRVVESTQDDPRSGKQTTVLTSFTPGEPDEALFHPPADYVTRDPERP